MATEEKGIDGPENENPSKDPVEVTASPESIKNEALDKNEKIIGPILPTPTPSDDSQLKDKDIFIGDNHCQAVAQYENYEILAASHHEIFLEYFFRKIN